MQATACSESAAQSCMMPPVIVSNSVMHVIICYSQQLLNAWLPHVSGSSSIQPITVGVNHQESQWLLVLKPCVPVKRLTGLLRGSAQADLTLLHLMCLCFTCWPSYCCHEWKSWCVQLWTVAQQAGLHGHTTFTMQSFLNLCCLMVFQMLIRCGPI